VHIDIELTNACNLKCSMCERKFMTRKMGYMDYGLFCKIIDQCAEAGICSVKLNLWGESLLHKDFFKMVGYAKEKGLFTQFNTNVTFVTKEVSSKLISCGLDRVTFSVEGFMSDLYESSRRGADFEKVRKNIENFIKLKPIGEKPLLTLQMIRMKKSFKYIPDFIKEFQDRVDFISVTNITAITGKPEILEESLIDYKSLSKIPCPEICLRLSVFWNGDVTVCCQDYEGFLTIGSIKENSLLELWHSEKLNKLRERHKKLDFSGLICEVCTANYKL